MMDPCENCGQTDVVQIQSEAPGVDVGLEYTKFRDAGSIEELVDVAERVLHDHRFPTVRAFTDDGGGAVACFPVYTPHEIVHALGMLPVTLHGGGETIDITKADAPLGSFLCSISKSTLELGLQGNLDVFDGFVFPYICDVSRNLEGIVARSLPDRTTHMLHLPQNLGSEAAVDFLVEEYRRLIDKLEKRAEGGYDPDQLADSIEVYNERRRWVGRLDQLKQKEPHRISLKEHYLIGRLGDLLPPRIHTEILQAVVDRMKDRERKARDAIRVVLVGPFCEQPTLDLIDLVEQVGCYVVDSDLLMRSRWHGPVETDSDPLQALARAYVESELDIGVRRAPKAKGEAILERVERADADGVVFLTAKSCEPALEDVVLYEEALDRAGIPSVQVEFEELSTDFQRSRLMLETFVESILFD